MNRIFSYVMAMLLFMGLTYKGAECIVNRSVENFQNELQNEFMKDVKAASDAYEFMLYLRQEKDAAMEETNLELERRKQALLKKLDAWAKKTGKYKAIEIIKRKYGGRIYLASKKYGVSQKLIRAIIVVESAGKSKSKSGKGAKGLMGLIPSTGKEMGARDIYQEYENIFAGTRYIKKMLDRYNGNLSLALAAYNAGPGTVKKYGGIPPYKETRNYIERVLFLKDHS